ncbi:MAG: DUF6497 family protein [Donghicola eburneus]|nr:DUF6497 family protein [Donghicola eburneus]MCI5038701.1 DUF6497 family protein [Donghicola eburneus]
MLCFATIGFVALLAVATTVRGQEGAPTVPSGLDLTLFELILENQPDGQVWARYRFVAPDLQQSDFDRVSGDFPEICASYALPELDARGTHPAMIVLSYADRPIPFGEAAPEAVQFVESFRVDQGACIWEVY